MLTKKGLLFKKKEQSLHRWKYFYIIYGRLTQLNKKEESSAARRK